MIVKAKRLGWAEKLTPEQEYDLEPLDYESMDLRGELVEFDVQATDEHPAMHVTLVNGQEADPKTVRYEADSN